MNIFDELASQMADQLAQAELEAEQLARQRATVLAMSQDERRAARRLVKKNSRKKKQDEKNSLIAVLDMETDPFDNQGQERIHPFAACIASDHFEPIEVWDEDPQSFVEKVISAIENLPDTYTIYAHNGGKFDYLFLVYKLRGVVSFKGRGIMAAKVGAHEIRDSFHILPEKLAAYRKDDFDYEKMRKGRRSKHKVEIQQYLRNDCLYLLDFIKGFIRENGLKLSIGQAAIASVKEAGVEVEFINEHMDTFLRQFYFGGRVECIEGIGEFNGEWKLYDVNSMYPGVMADREHPVGAEYIIRRGKNIKPGPNTFFLALECKNYGAFVCRDEDGSTTATRPEGLFFTTIWEYQVALKHDLIDDIVIHYVVDCQKHDNFGDFVNPKYEQRQVYKHEMKTMLANGLTLESEEYLDRKVRDILLKFYLNNAYGKYAQNPRRFKENYITAYGERPDSDDWGVLPVYDNEEMNYAIWEKPVETLRFKNVGTSASITGAARAVLLDAICNAVEPIYCDTDSLICRDLLGVELHGTKLGAWDLEDTFETVRIAGKKMYACQRSSDNALKKGKLHKIASKGIKPPTWNEYGDLIMGHVLESTAFAPTLTKRMTQDYPTRRIRATAKAPNNHLLGRLRRAS